MPSERGHTTLWNGIEKGLDITRLARIIYLAIIIARFFIRSLGDFNKKQELA